MDNIFRRKNRLKAINESVEQELEQDVIKNTLRQSLTDSKPKLREQGLSADVHEQNRQVRKKRSIHEDMAEIERTRGFNDTEEQEESEVVEVDTNTATENPTIRPKQAFKRVTGSRYNQEENLPEVESIEEVSLQQTIEPVQEESVSGVPKIVKSESESKNIVKTLRSKLDTRSTLQKAEEEVEQEINKNHVEESESFSLDILVKDLEEKNYEITDENIFNNLFSFYGLNQIGLITLSNGLKDYENVNKSLGVLLFVDSEQNLIYNLYGSAELKFNKVKNIKFEPLDRLDIPEEDTRQIKRFDDLMNIMNYFDTILGRALENIEAVKQKTKSGQISFVESIRILKESREEITESYPTVLSFLSDIYPTRLNNYILNETVKKVFSENTDLTLPIGLQISFYTLDNKLEIVYEFNTDYTEVYERYAKEYSYILEESPHIIEEFNTRLEYEINKDLAIQAGDIEYEYDKSIWNNKINKIKITIDNKKSLINKRNLEDFIDYFLLKRF